MVTGFFKAKVVAINPEKDWIDKYYEETEEPVYNYERRGDRICEIHVYLQSPTDILFKYVIELKDKEKSSKTGAFQYINCLGDTQYVNDESKLFDSFKNFEQILSWKKDGEIFEKYKPGAVPNEKEVVGRKQFKIAKEGEEQLLHLVKMIENPNLYDIDTNIFIDLEKLFSGNFSTLQKLLSKDFHFIAFAYVDKNLQQQVFNRFLKLDFYRDVINDMNISQYNKKAYSEWLKTFEATCTECYSHLGKIQEFKEEHKKQLTNDGSDY
jgi:hypothetical protein